MHICETFILFLHVNYFLRLHPILSINFNTTPYLKPLAGGLRRYFSRGFQQGLLYCIS